MKMNDGRKEEKMGYETILTCDMEKGCKEVVTHIDNKGYVYCHAHGVERKSWRPCRKLSPKELEQLKAGTPLASY